MKRHDSHVHFFENGFPGRYGAWFPDGQEVTVYEAFRKEHAVERALVVGFEGAPWAAGNNYTIARLASRHSWMAPVAYDALEQVPEPVAWEAWWQRRFAGLSFYLLQPEQEAVLHSVPSAVWEVVNRWRAVISINCVPEVAGRLRPVWEQLPDARILFSHLGLPGALAEGAEDRLQPVLKLADLPQIGVKLSAAYATGLYPHPGLERLVLPLREAYGEERLYWGSDFSPVLADATFAQALEAFTRFQWEQPDAIFGGNLQRVLERVEA